jgi:Uma2 family endonuclease
MNIQQKMPATAEEFLVWNEGREGKREFVSGRVVEMMINVTRHHYFIAARLQNQLSNQLGLINYIVGSADFGVKTGTGIRFPDILVESVGGPGKALSTAEPLLIAEILSASSMADDFGPKAQEYLAIQSLRHYLVLSQDEARIWVWSRNQDGRWEAPEIAAGFAETVRLNGFGATINLQQIYAGIVNA